MTKNILLAAAALSAMAFAGAASAHTLTYRTAASPNINGSAPGGATGGTGGATLPYKLAVESTVTTPTSAIFELAATLSTGSTFPSGNNFIQIDLNNGSFASGLTSATVAAPGCTVVLSSGGASGSTTARFLVSSAGAGCNIANLDLPVTPGATGSTVVTTTLTTEAGSPIDPDGTNTTTAPNQEQLAIVTRPSAFNAFINGVIGQGALDDTYATLTVTPVYTTFKVGTPGHANATETATVGQLGTIGIAVDTTAYRDLAKNLVGVADVQSASIVTVGNFSAFNGTGGSATLGGAAGTFNTAATQVTHTAAGGSALLGTLVETGTTVAAPDAFIVTRETTAVAIPTSDYRSTVTYQLNPTFYVENETAQGDLERIGRDGTNVVFPWLNDETVSGQSGTTNRIRLGNTGTAATGPVYAEVLNQTGSVSRAPVQIAPNIPANGEVRISTASLTAALGAFGRGDVRISVEAPPANITARRYLQTANGGITELSNGTVASEQTPADSADVE